MEIWHCAAWISGAGALGGLANALNSANGFALPRRVEGVWCPGAISTVLLGANSLKNRPWGQLGAYHAAGICQDQPPEWTVGEYHSQQRGVPQLFKLRERSACTVPLCCDGCKAAKFLSPATSSVVDRMYACGHLGISLAPDSLKAEQYRRARVRGRGREKKSSTEGVFSP